MQFFMQNGVTTSIALGFIGLLVARQYGVELANGEGEMLIACVAALLRGAQHFVAQRLPAPEAPDVARDVERP